MRLSDFVNMNNIDEIVLYIYILIYTIYTPN